MSIMLQILFNVYSVVDARKITFDGVLAKTESVLALKRNLSWVLAEAFIRLPVKYLFFLKEFPCS